jgi:hypothetical protein
MLPIWLIFGIVIILSGIFNKQLLHFMGIKPMSEIFTSANLKRSSRKTEQIGRGILILLGASFLVLGLGNTLPENWTYPISLVLLGLVGVMLVAIFGITIANWKAR